MQEQGEPMTTVVIGADLAKTTYVGAAWTGRKAEGLGTFPNRPDDFPAFGTKVAAVAARLGADHIQLVLEPTGGYELALANWAYQQGWTVSLPNPKHVRDWAKGMGIRAKTDKVDARMLAHYGAQAQPRPWHPLPAPVAALAQLLDRKADLEQALLAERNRREAAALDDATLAVVRQSFAQVIASLEQALATVEQAITAHLEAQPALAAEVALLLTVPGVGEKTVLGLLVLLHRWQALTQGQGASKGLVAYVGLDPTPHQSGTSVHRPSRISKAGDPVARRLLYLGALGGVRGHSVLGEFYRRLRGRGKPAMLARIAAARKILIWAWAVFRTHVPFDPAKVTRPVSVPA
jgi:transposase